MLCACRFHEHYRGGRRALSERFGFFLRVLSGEVGVADNKMNLCLSVCFAGFLGRAIPIELLWGRPTMTSVFRRLAWRSEHNRTSKILDMRRREPRMCFFSFTDDTGRAHGHNTAYPYIDTHTGAWSVDREMLTVSAYTKKSSEDNAKVNYDTLKKRGYPMSNMGGGGGDHPAEKEIRITVQMAMMCSSWLALWWACGAHKTALICKHISMIVCPDKVMGVFTHKQLGFAFRYVWVCGKQNYAHVVAATANQWMGCTGWWSNIPKMMQVCIDVSYIYCFVIHDYLTCTILALSVCVCVRISGGT